jgi:hypothetical protein
MAIELSDCTCTLTPGCRAQNGVIRCGSDGSVAGMLASRSVPNKASSLTVRSCLRLS